MKMCELCLQIARTVFETRANKEAARRAVLENRDYPYGWRKIHELGEWGAFSRQTSCPQICTLVKLLQASMRIKLQPAHSVRLSRDLLNAEND
jgi:hypothetical protein